MAFKRKKNSVVRAETPAGVYKNLIEDIGAAGNSYDFAFISELAAALGVPRAEDIPAYLEMSSVSVEKFVATFFKVAQPLVKMLKDILETFEQAGAKYGDHNLQVKFNFSKTSEMSIDLDHFRQWLEVEKRIRITEIPRIWSAGDVWKLCHCIQNYNVTPSDQGIQDWLSVYENGSEWPTRLPSVPRTGHQALDDQMLAIWRLMEDLFRQFRRYGPGREALRAAGRRAMERRGWMREDRITAVDPDIFGEEKDYDDAYTLMGIDSDYWFAMIARLCCGVPQYVKSIDMENREHFSGQLADAIKEIFNECAATERPAEEIIKCLNEFLNLPMWKKRHEIYSVWAGCQLAMALGPDRMTMHPVDGALSFSFKGVHLGTWKREPTPIYLWCEVRSPLDKPRGLGRKKAIQPDYRVIPAPMSSPERAELVVECKQYWTGDARGFSDAVIDYARGCPESKVILVNYGSIPVKTAELIDCDLANRVILIENFHPGYEKQIELFTRSVNEYLSLPVSQPENQSTSRSRFGQETWSVTLKWGSAPRDLDLHLFAFPALEQPIDISFPQRNTRIPLGAGHVFYHNDITHSYGPEIIDIVSPGEGVYIIYVNQYSSDGFLYASRATITLESAGRVICTMNCPQTGNARNWVAFALIVNRHSVQMIEISKLTDESVEKFVKNL